MRPLAVAALAASFALTSASSTALAQTASPKSATPRRTATSAAKRRTVPATPAVNSESSEGLMAAGTMPAATGPAKTLFALKYVDLKIGTGELALPRKWYTVNYTGWTTDGKKFDSSYDHDGGQPFFFPVGARRVITGWDTGFEGMRVGGKRRLIVPYQLAYGEPGRPPVIPAKSDLIFDLELLSQSDTPPQQPAPVPPAGSAPAALPPAKQETKPVQQPGTNPLTDPKTQTNVPANEKPQK